MFTPVLLVVLGTLPAAEPAAPTHVLETADARHVVATLTYTVRCDRLRAEEWVVFLPQCTELPGQNKVESRLDLGGSVVKELSPLKRPLLMARLPVRSKELETGYRVRATYEATLRGGS